MIKSTIAILLAAVICAACSKSSDENTASPSARKSGDSPAEVVNVATSPQNSSTKASINAEIPAEINGLAFELGGKCGIDLINSAQRVEVVSIMRQEGLIVDGWALDEKQGTVPPTTVLQLVNGNLRYYAVLTRHGGDRQDLVKEFGQPIFNTAGYSASIDIAQLPSAEYEMLVIQKSGKKNLVCPTYRKLVIKS